MRLKSSSAMSLETDRSAVKAGALSGAGVGGIAALELLLANRRTLQPDQLAPAGLLLFVAFAVVGAIGAATYAVFGARFVRLLRGRSDDGANAFGLLAAGFLLWPRGLELVAAAFLFVARLLRRRVAPRHPRLDGFILVFTLGASAFLIIDRLPLALPESSPSSGETSGVPFPGSISVTITIHSAPEFPAIPAVHPATKELASSALGAKAALWSGRAPARTSVGVDGGRRLLGNAPLSWIPDRGFTKILVRGLSRPLAADDVLVNERPLEVFAEGAHIPVVRTLPDSTDPALCLRILEMERAPTVEEAERLVKAGAWIDVQLPGHEIKESLAFAGEGVRLAPASEPVSLLDVTPTALHLLGLAVPRDSDGRVLLELLDPAGPGGRAPRYRSRATGRSRPRKASIVST